VTVRYPWAQVRSLAITGITLKVDGEPVTCDVDPAARHIRPHLSEVAAWSVADLKAHVELDGDLPNEHGVVAVLRCVRTRTRQHVRFDRTDNTWSATMRIHREDVVGRCTIEVTAEGTVDGVSHRRLGQCEPWTIDLDPVVPAVTAGRSPFDVRWVDFTDPADGGPALLKSLKDQLFYVHAEPDPPVLYLNDGVRNLKDLLNWDAARGWKRDLRDSIADDISAKTLLILAERAIGEIYPDDEGQPVPPYREISARLLERLAEHVEGLGSLEELCEQVVIARKEADALNEGRLQGLLVAGVDELLGRRSTAERITSRVYD
jgi:hypothetical protein